MAECSCGERILRTGGLCSACQTAQRMAELADESMRHIIAERDESRASNSELVELLRQSRAMIDRLTENDHPGYEEWKALDDGIRAALEGR